MPGCATLKAISTSRRVWYLGARRRLPTNSRIRLAMERMNSGISLFTSRKRSPSAEAFSRVSRERETARHQGGFSLKHSDKSKRSEIELTVQLSARHHCKSFACKSS